MLILRSSASSQDAEGCRQEGSRTAHIFGLPLALGLTRLTQNIKVTVVAATDTDRLDQAQVQVQRNYRATRIPPR
jgi:hypothetical protein